MFLQYQEDINVGWKRFIKPMNIKKQRDNHYCKDCNEKGYRIKMDYLGNDQEKEKYTIYDVAQYKCPRCEKVYKEKMRIEGKGTLGVNSGKEYGGK